MFLEEFLSRLSSKNYFWNSPEMCLFCKNSSSDFQSLLKPIKKPKISEIRAKYSEVFQDFSGYEINTRIIAKLGCFFEMAKKFKSQVAHDLENLKGYFLVRPTGNAALVEFLNEIMPAFEKEVIGFYNDQNDKMTTFGKKEKEGLLSALESIVFFSFHFNFPDQVIDNKRKKVKRKIKSRSSSRCSKENFTMLKYLPLIPLHYKLI